jgi:GSH-dependent disulfide-bond oxidoreductase
VAYGAIRYTNEVHRLYGVLDGQLKGQGYIAGDYSIADMLTWPWVASRTSSALDLDDFPDLKAWQARVEARAAVGRAMAKSRDFVAGSPRGQGPESQAARSVLFGQRART